MQAMGTPDGRWRVEVHISARAQRHRYGFDWYRVIHDGQEVADHLVIGQVLHMLNEAGVNLSTLRELPEGEEVCG